MFFTKSGDENYENQIKFGKRTFAELEEIKEHVFRWFKFTLKTPYTITHGNLLTAIWDTSHWTSFVKFGLKTA